MRSNPSVRLALPGAMLSGNATAEKDVGGVALGAQGRTPSVSPTNRQQSMPRAAEASGNGPPFSPATPARAEEDQLSTRGVALTARWTAALRDIEHQRPDRLFRDDLAGALAGGPAAVLRWNQELNASTRGKPDGRSHIAIRCRAFDYLILEQLNSLHLEYGFVQVVSLGSGM